jgi:inosine/xanthosine triphosphate pyrophosphatase family protein
VGSEAVGRPSTGPLESGPSHKANAEQKAIAWSRAWGSLAIASDGGLAVPALKERWSSLQTRRFVESAEDDTVRAEALIEMVRSLPAEERTAHWTEAVVLADSGEVLSTFQAESGQGVIGATFDPAHIHGGFWVGAVWRFPELGKAYAELTEDELHRVGDHWTTLKEQVQRYFRAEYIY